MKMKKWLTVLLAVLLACGAFPAGSFAEEQGLFQYEVKKNGTAKITGINDTTIKTLEIPAELDGHPVTSIGRSAFINLKNLQLVVIPEGVSSVETLAFEHCTSLESVSIPDSLVSVELLAFAFCPKLKTVVVSPDHPVLAVENKALVNRKNQALIVALEHEETGTYTVAQGIREIGGFAFDSCLFSAILLPDSVTSVGNGAFRKCVNLTEIILPEGVTKVGAQLFFGCENLVSVTIPDSLTRIGTALFGKAPALTDVRISLDHPAYKMTGSLLVDKRNKEIVSALNNLPETYEIPEGIRIIGSMAFQGNSDLAEVVVPKGVTRIKYAAFSGCGLRVITLPATLREIEKNAFEGNRGLLIKAPAGSLAEEFSKYRYSFEALPDESGVKEQDLSREDKADETAESTPEESADDVREESFDSRVSGMYRYEVLEDGTAKIVRADRSLRDGNIPAELDGIPVTAIGNEAFLGCADLQSVVIPEGVVFVEKHAFYACPALESVSIPDSLVSLGGQMFVSCGNLKTVEISPAHPVFAVENRALVNRQDQTLIISLDREDTGTYTVAEGIRRIEEHAFDGCSFSSVLLPDSVVSVGNFAFGSCRNLTGFILPEGVAEIGNQVFYSCGKLESVTIPDSLTGIGLGLFGHNPALEEIWISPDHPVYEMNGPLLVNKRNREIVSVLNNAPAVFKIPEGIEAIGDEAFMGCTVLTEVIVPEGVKRIGESAFCGCPNLQTVTFTAGTTELAEEAFKSSWVKLIKAPAGSRAEEYALENGLSFEALPAGTGGAD